MASPQPSHHTKLSNELLEAWIELPIGNAARVLLWMARNTYGWGKKKLNRQMTAWDIHKVLGISYGQAKRVFKGMVSANLITPEGIQKDYDKWNPAAMWGNPHRLKNAPVHKKTGPSSSLSVAHQGTTSYPYSKEKRKPQKASDVKTEGFDEFWKHYPRKVSKGEARKAWMKIPESKYDQIIAAVKNQALVMASSAPKFKGDKDYRKHPATWLNKECWEDELESGVNNDNSSLFS